MEKPRFWLMPAAGWAKTVDHVKRLAEVPVITHIVAGSFTVVKREGNTGGTNFYVADDGTSTNSLGIPNGGIPYLTNRGEEMVRVAHDASKEFVLSIAGFSPNEYGLLAQAGIDIGADVVEVNAGCPNVWSGGEQKDIVSFSPPLLTSVIEAVELTLPADKPWWLKISPTANPKDRERITAVLLKARCSALVATNTFPNVSLYLDDDKPALDVANNYGGMAGTALKPIALSNCRHYHELLPNLPIIGVGGVATGRDILDYRRVANCRGVQVGTAFFQNENLRVFQEMLSEYLKLPEVMAL